MVFIIKTLVSDAEALEKSFMLKEEKRNNGGSYKSACKPACKSSAPSKTGMAPVVAELINPPPMRVPKAWPVKATTHIFHSFIIGILKHRTREALMLILYGCLQEPVLYKRGKGLMVLMANNISNFFAV